MKHTHTIGLLLLLLFCSWQPLKGNEHAERREPLNKQWSEATKAYIKEELNSVKMPFYPEYSNSVKRWIKRHITRGSKTFEAMMGKAEYYFPIFEYYLEKAGLPSELKYLAMVESGLHPSIESPVGAGGLWQFMPQTARFYELEINEWVDERRDPYKATESAVRLLKDLYRQFNDWELVLAAYNCGPGRVQRAIRTAGSKNYNHIKKYLPNQTREYLIKYVATTFVGEKHATLGLKPRPSVYKQDETSVMKLYNWVSFSTVSQVCSISLKVIRDLNPSYLKDIIPKSIDGNYLVIPDTSALTFENHLKANGVTRIEYLFGEPIRPEPKMEYWVSASVRPRRTRSLLQWNIQGFLQWGKFWGKSVFSTLKLSNLFT